MDKNTIVVNLFAGPGAGKTTCAWEIASELKKRNIETEYVSEYAKELVWDNNLKLLDGSLNHQKLLHTEQERRINRLIGKVDVVVTDSPTLLNLMYLKERNLPYEKEVIQRFKQHNNFNLFINRSKEFQQTGRIHNLEESKSIDNRIKSFLRDNDIYFGTYYHKTVDVLIDNIVKNIETVNKREKINEGRKNIMKKTKYPIEKFDANGNLTYWENSSGLWVKSEFDKNGNLTYYENSGGKRQKFEYDKNGNLTYMENSSGYWQRWEYDKNGNPTSYKDIFGSWQKWEYDKNGNQTYYENSKGEKFRTSLDIKKILERLEENAWNNKGETTAYLVTANDVIILNAYVYEPCYEAFSTAHSIKLNDEILFAEHSHNVSAYHNEAYTIGKFKMSAEAVNYLEQYLRDKNVTLQYDPPADEKKQQNKQSMKESIKDKLADAQAKAAEKNYKRDQQEKDKVTPQR